MSRASEEVHLSRTFMVRGSQLLEGGSSGFQVKEAASEKALRWEGLWYVRGNEERIDLQNKSKVRQRQAQTFQALYMPQDMRVLIAN